MKTEKKYKGIVVPAVTPLTADHQLDDAAVERLFSHFHRHKANPFILGTTGEAASLPLSLKHAYIQLAGKLKKSGDVLYAGISSNCLRESIDLARNSFDAGADVVVATLPFYYPLTENGMRRYFEQLAEAIAGPLILYNIPATTHMSIPLHVVDGLSHHENIVGIKDSERNEERLKEALERWANREDFSHFLGWASKSAEALIEGGDGLVPSTGNLHPGLYSEMYAAVQNGNQERALELQKLSDQLGQLYQQGRTLGESLWALKFLMKEAGFCQSHVMPPLFTASDGEATQLKSKWRQFFEKEKIQFV